jgi:capsular exopolysaccharide synthesis family protein
MERDLRGYLRVVWKRRWYALAGFLLAFGAAVAYSVSVPRVYQSSATLFVGQSQVTLQDVNQGLALADLSSRMVKSYAQILSSRALAERAVAEGALNVTPSQIQAGLNVNPIVDTLILRMTYSANDPDTAQRVATAVADAFVKQIKEIDTPDASKGGPVAVNVAIVDAPTRPGSPVSPRPKRDAALGGILGIMLGIGLAIGRESLDVSVKNRQDAERLGLPVIGQIPKLKTHGDDIYIERDAQDIGGEAFRKLRTSIGFLGVEGSIRTVLVTSAFAGEGKTTCALNLAVAYADAGYQTLLVEADLRRPSLHRIFGLSGTDGLTTAIIGGTSPYDVLREGNVPNLKCLVAGAIPPNPVELLESHQMAELLQRLRAQFEMVVIDSPPLIPVADSVTLAPRCDGVVVVARGGSTNRDRLVDAVQQVEKSGGRFLGVLMNAVKPTDSPYEYEYYYTYRAGSPGGTGPQ